MRTSLFFITVALLAIPFAIGGLFASEVDELRERAEALRREAAELEESGREAEAARIEREADELDELADRHGEREAGAELRREIEELREALEDLLAEERELEERDATPRERAELREEIDAHRRELRELEREQRRGHGDVDDDLHHQAQRIEHVRTAVRHLQEAGLDDIARELNRRAEQMTRELHHARERTRMERARHHGHHGPEDDIRLQMRELARTVDELRREVVELRKRVDED